MSAFATIAIAVLVLAVARYVVGASIAVVVVGGLMMLGGAEHGASGALGGIVLGVVVLTLLVRWFGSEAGRGDEIYFLADPFDGDWEGSGLELTLSLGDARQ